MNLKIEDRSSFVDHFLTPLSKAENACVLNLSESGITALLATTDNTVIVFANYKKDMPGTVTAKLNIPDLNRLIKILNCISTTDVTLDLTLNSVKYEGSNVRFTYHLLEDGILSVPPLSIQKIKQLTYDTSFTVTYASFINLIKGSSFVNNLNKAYFSTKNGQVYVELSDRQSHNVDSISFKLCDTFTGTSITNPLPISFETIRVIANAKFNKINVFINTKLNVMAFEVTNDDIKNTYIVSGLVK